jgi:ABC-type sugar transport system substrate-binding protein
MFLASSGTSSAATPFRVDVSAVKGVNPGATGVAVPVAGKLNNVTISYISFSSNPFFVPIQVGVNAAEAKLKAHGANVSFIDAGSGITIPEVVSAMQGAVVNGSKAIGVIPLAVGACPAIAAAVKAGVAVATAVSEGACSHASGSLFYVGANDLTQGVLGAKAMAQAIDCTGQVGVITDTAENSGVNQRTIGFAQEMHKICPKVKIVGTVYNTDSTTMAYTQAQNFMTAYPQLRGIFQASGGDAGAGSAIKAANKSGRVAMIGYDFVPQVVTLLKQGAITALIGQDPFQEGYNTVVDLFNYLVTKHVPQPYHQYVTIQVMTRSNVSAVLKTQAG